MKKKTNRPLRYLLAVYLTGIAFFMLFRIANTLVFRFSSGAQHWGFDLLKAFGMGWRFDTVISGYILALPLLCILAGGWCGIRHKAYYAVLHCYTAALYITAFFACAADIPYFHYFFNRLNISALAWADSPAFVVKMILEEPAFLIYLLLFLIVAAGYISLMRLFRRRWLTEATLPRRGMGYALTSLLLIALCFTGMRGRISIKSPIRVGTAYFSNNAFLNQLGLNPLFTFLNSVSESRKNRQISLVDAETAIRTAETQLQEFFPESPECVRLKPGTNVVLVIMESMAAHKVGHYNPESRLTPCLDSLISGSLCFENAYSAGIHTYNGIYSTLFSHPAILDRHSMKRTVIPEMCGLPNQLRKKGYHTLYFTTHDDQFDNVAGFLHANAVERIVSQKDYPAKAVKSTLGVPDHVMFDRAVEELDKERQPFFACLMTASDHNPYILPDDIGWEPRSKNIGEKMVEYADWAIGRFIRKAKQTSWFANTLFVFVADHGASGETIYDMSLSYHHIPLLFYCPAQIPARQVNSLALQIDIGPTLLGMLFPDEPNLTLGLDLQRQRRRYAFFSADNKIGVLDSLHFYRYRITDGCESLYLYRQQDRKDHLPEQRSKADSMRTYGFSMIQYSYELLESGKVCRRCAETH